MQILIDNKKISNFTFIQEGMNSLGYDSLNEVFFDVFEIKSNNIDLIKEKKGDINGNPIVELDLCINNEIYKNVRFVLKENNTTSINPNLLDYTKAVSINAKPVSSNSRKLVSENTNSYNKQINTEESLLEKNKQKFLNSIRDEIMENLKQEIKAGLISNLLKSNIQTNFDSIIEESANQFKLQKYFQNQNNKFRKELIEISEKIARRESMRFSEGGGGTNATQYRNGGDIEGVLNIDGNLIVNGQNYIKRVVFLVGDGMQQSFTFNHNLNSKDILVNVQDTTNDEIVVPYIKLVDENTIMVEFSFVPDINNYRLIIFG